MGGPPKLNVNGKDPLQAAVDIATLPYRANLAAADRLVDPTRKSFGMPTRDEARDAKIDAERNADANARASAINDALSDKTLDAKTRQELLALYQGGADTSALSSQINLARAGKGIYGIRKLNQNQLAIKAKTPGREQVLSLGSGTVLG